MFDLKISSILTTSQNHDIEFDHFKPALDEAIQRNTPLKKRFPQESQALFINKKITKEIKKWSRLRNIFLNTKSDIYRSGIADNKTFWKTVKLFFTDKIKIKSKITHIEKNLSRGKVKRKQFQKK